MESQAFVGDSRGPEVGEGESKAVWKRLDVGIAIVVGSVIVEADFFKVVDIGQDAVVVGT
jgi:hypothetical protein